MATRPDTEMKNACIVTREVETGQTVAVGRVVIDGNADHECQHASAGGVGAMGVVTSLGKLAGAAGDKVSVALLAGACVIPVLVGTGGATRGKKAKVVANGVADSTPAGAGTTAIQTVGFFTQSGVAGDIVGMVPQLDWITE